jgi:hypothetical protein
VVAGHAVDEGGVHAGEVAVGQQDAEVGVVGEGAVDLDAETAPDRVRDGGERPDHALVAL